ncbi:glycosyltransferase family protein [Acetobacter orleanensis]|uniref:Uncharacterized protein n=1 Tax=Acetobacter orleanensis TaxID=104099 RepID=A0A4Y3TMT7_9PROT|nr:hypothetical protein [Acetobacter orleanensis]KXV65211.1 hypothetical protein AD949_04920 [Acetobacter orleanensis]PCD79645.1 hypothetical protein CO710_05390 [Acetobacter orleanensis]GAN68746.1 hypothetical protein Abol_021_101 [Acetobacter orleanensis JCM 7639]GBR28017.1 hypothetical protein AA0473_1610 [Acetobacter orleanensis NRIC 0473]GEB82280.1 hypothetical protein AOR01nite_07570 [Acetobacter orleanensis]
MDIAFSRPALRRWPLWHVALLVLLPVLVHLPELIGPFLPGHITSDPLSILSVATTTRRDWLEGGLLPGLPGWIDGCAGVIVQALGHLVASDWRQGILPWWNPYSGVGMPLAGEYQPAAFFFPFVLLLGLPGGLLLMKIALQIVAGVAMYAFLRALRLDGRAVLVGAVLYAFNGTYAWASDGPSQPLAFLPLVLFGIEQARFHKGLGGWGWLSVGLGYLLLSGFPETAFLVGTLGLCWAVLRLVQQPASARLSFALRILAGGSAALLLAAPQIIAFADFLREAWVGPHAGMMDVSLPRSSWLMALFPYVNGLFFYGHAEQLDAWWAMGGYTGLVVPFLALVALFGKRERPARLMLAAYVLVCVGKQANLPGITQLVDALPGVGRTVFYRLCFPAEQAALLILALLGLDDLCCATSGVHAVQVREYFKRPVVWAGAILTAVICGVWWLNAPTRAALRTYSHGPVPSWGYEVASVLFGGMTVALCVAGLLRAGRRMTARGRVTLVSAGLLGEALVLFCVPLVCMRPALPRNVPLLQTVQRELGLQRFLSMGVIAPNYGAYFRLPSLNHNGVPMPSAWVERMQHDFGPDVNPVTFDGITPNRPDGQFFLAETLAKRPEIFEKLGVALALVPHGFPLPGSEALAPENRLKLLYSDASADVYRLPHAAPYFEAGAGCSVQAESRTQVRTQCAAPSFLVRRELMMAGWTATLNGHSVVPMFEDGLFERILLPAGQADIRFNFTPPFMVWGWADFMAGLALLGLGFAKKRTC